MLSIFIKKGIWFQWFHNKSSFTENLLQNTTMIEILNHLLNNPEDSKAMHYFWTQASSTTSRSPGRKIAVLKCLKNEGSSLTQHNE